MTALRNFFHQQRIDAAVRVKTRNARQTAVGGLPLLHPRERKRRAHAVGQADGRRVRDDGLGELADRTVAVRARRRSMRGRLPPRRAGVRTRLGRSGGAPVAGVHRTGGRRRSARGVRVPAPSRCRASRRPSRSPAGPRGTASWWRCRTRGQGCGTRPSATCSNHPCNEYARATNKLLGILRRSPPCCAAATRKPFSNNLMSAC